MTDVDRVQGGKWIKELEIQELHEKVYSLMEEKKSVYKKSNKKSKSREKGKLRLF